MKPTEKDKGWKMSKLFNFVFLVVFIVLLVVCMFYIDFYYTSDCQTLKNSFPYAQAPMRCIR